MNNFKSEEIAQLLKEPDYEDSSLINPKVYSAIYSLGRDAENEEEYQYSFAILLSLCDRQSQKVRAQAILAMSLLAVMHKRLERKIIEPIIKREWKTANDENKAKIEDAVDDINHALQWNLKL